MKVDVFSRRFRADAVETAMGDELYYALAECGYVDLMASLRYKDVPADEICRLWDDLPRETKNVCRVLQLGEVVDAGLLPGMLGDALIALADSGLTSMDLNDISLNGLSLQVIDGVLYFCEVQGARSTLYYGSDTLALAHRQQVRICGETTVLDVCAGPGIQGLLAARCGANVTSLELNPVAAELCECNAAVNGFSDRMLVVRGDVCDFQPSKSFDYVFANPPLLPIPDEVNYPFVGDGGPDGLSVVRDILTHCVDAIGVGGRLTLIGISPGSNGVTAIEDLVSALCAGRRLRCILCVFGQDGVSEGSNWVRSVCESVNRYEGTRRYTPEQIAEMYLRGGVDEVYSFSLSLIDSDSPSVILLESYTANPDGLGWWL